MTSLPSGIRFIERDWLSCNQVLMCDDPSLGHFSLVDSGYVKHEAFTLSLIRHALGSGKLSRLINTHLHSDHCGGNALLHQEFACQIWVPQACFDWVQSWDQDKLSFASTGQRCPQFRADRSIQPAEKFEAGGVVWQAIASPGHDPASLMFFAAQEKILISADALWENGFGVLFPELIGESGLNEQAQVLDLIEQLNPAIVLPGHGPMFTDLAAALARARERLKAYREKPERVARNSIKVLVKYLLLDREKVHIEQFIQEQSLTKLNLAAAQMLGKPLPDLLRQALFELAEIKAVRIQGDFALNQ